MDYISTKMKKQIPGGISQAQQEPGPNPDAAAPQAFPDGGGFYPGGRPSSHMGPLAPACPLRQQEGGWFRYPVLPFQNWEGGENWVRTIHGRKMCLRDPQSPGQGAAFRVGLREKSRPPGAWRSAPAKGRTGQPGPVLRKESLSEVTCA